MSLRFDVSPGPNSRRPRKMAETYDRTLNQVWLRTLRNRTDVLAQWRASRGELQSLLTCSTWFPEKAHCLSNFRPLIKSSAREPVTLEQISTRAMSALSTKSLFALPDVYRTVVSAYPVTKTGDRPHYSFIALTNSLIHAAFRHRL